MCAAQSGSGRICEICQVRSRKCESEWLLEPKSAESTGSLLGNGNATGKWDFIRRSETTLLTEIPWAALEVWMWSASVGMRCVNLIQSCQEFQQFHRALYTERKREKQRQWKARGAWKRERSFKPILTLNNLPPANESTSKLQLPSKRD